LCVCVIILYYILYYYILLYILLYYILYYTLLSSSILFYSPLLPLFPPSHHQFPIYLLFLLFPSSSFSCSDPNLLLFLPSSSFPIFLINPSLPIQQHGTQYSFYTCRYFHALIYILLLSSPILFLYTLLLSSSSLPSISFPIFILYLSIVTYAYLCSINISPTI